MALPKYIFVTGGVSSSLGKGILAASLAKLLQARGYSVTIQKFDPYINVDPGTMNPYEHGECYVTDDGAETDLDLGHYERFLNISTSRANNVTTGQIYKHVIERERKGDFHGKTVQVIPHITDEIKVRFQKLSLKNEYDIIITEIGGTVGDIESLPYIEALRQFRYERKGDALVVHLTYIPFLKGAGELKTKPTQHSVKTLMEAGVQADILVCRTEYPIPEEMRKKLALFCNVEQKAVIEAIDTDTIYEVPLLIQEEKLDEVTLEMLKMPFNEAPKLEKWKKFLHNLKNPTQEVKIAVIGKYTELPDAYKSIRESFIHAGASKSTKVNTDYISSENITKDNSAELLSGYDGVLVAPGFGERGIEGKINAIKYLREQKIPFFGICLGMQCAAIEFARNVLGYSDAHTSEVNSKSEHLVIDIMEEQKSITNLGGTLRLGAHPCEIKADTLASEIYGVNMIMERHRHRYEFNSKYQDIFNENGMITSGINPVNKLVEIIELKAEIHPFFIGVQYHPELRSTVKNPHPIFSSFIEAALNFKNK